MNAPLHTTIPPLPALPTHNGWGCQISERTRALAAICIDKLDAIDLMTNNPTVLANVRACRAKVEEYLDGNRAGMLGENGIMARIDDLVTQARWHGRDRLTGGPARRQAERDAARASAAFDHIADLEGELVQREAA